MASERPPRRASNAQPPPAPTARVVGHRPEPPSDEPLRAPGAPRARAAKPDKPALTRDEINALLEVRKAMDGHPETSRPSRWWNPRVLLLVPLGPVAWLAQTFLPGPLAWLLMIGCVLVGLDQIRRMLARGRGF